MTLQDLGNALGINAYQVQKYETGQNRISASRLYQLAEIFEKSVDWFFEGLPPKRSGKAKTKSGPATTIAVLEEKGGDVMEHAATSELLQLFYSIRDDKVRQQFIKMLKSASASQ